MRLNGKLYSYTWQGSEYAVVKYNAMGLFFSLPFNSFGSNKTVGRACMRPWINSQSRRGVYWPRESERTPERRHPRSHALTAGLSIYYMLLRARSRDADITSSPAQRFCEILSCNNPLVNHSSLWVLVVCLATWIFLSLFRFSKSYTLIGNKY